MGFKSKFLIISTLILSSSANAALIERLGGLAYYDDVADLTWLADANSNGRMNWADANTWAANLDVAGVTGWRLPDSDTCSGYNCTGSEMGNLFYNVLGGSAGSSILSTHNANYDLFNNVQLYTYWSAKEEPGVTTYARTFRMDGYQYGYNKTYNFNAWAVQSGDAGLDWVDPNPSAVPVPAAVWLFGSGLIGLVGVARRKKA